MYSFYNYNKPLNHFPARILFRVQLVSRDWRLFMRWLYTVAYADAAYNTWET